MRTRLVIELAPGGVPDPAAGDRRRAGRPGKQDEVRGARRAAGAGRRPGHHEGRGRGGGPAAQGRGRGAAVNLPAHCRVEGTIDRRAGAEGKPYGIGFAVALPDAWNGRFLFQGGGGLNGTVGLPLGAQAAGDSPALVRGFAVVSTDTGHQASGGAFDAAFMRDQQAVLDFEYVAVGRVAVLAKEIVARYYGRPADRSYFAGCSTGGREAMLMAQRYPAYFDGVIAGAPAMRTGYSGLGDRWVATMLNQAAPKDAAGKPIPAQIFSESDKQLIVNALLSACDAKDGARDGLVYNTRACDFDPVAALTCKGAEDRRLPAAAADGGAQEGVCRTEGLTPEPDLPGLPVGHRHHGERTGHSRPPEPRPGSARPSEPLD